MHPYLAGFRAARIPPCTLWQRLDRFARLAKRGYKGTLRQPVDHRVHQLTQTGWHTAAQSHRFQLDVYAPVPLLEPRDVEKAPDEAATGPRRKLEFRHLAVIDHLLNAGAPHETIPGLLIPADVVGSIIPVQHHSYEK